MPLPSKPLTKLGFLTIGLFDGADPRRGHESTLEIIELGERLGFDSAWVRHRHLQYGISSPIAVLAAASQRTSRIELGTAVIPLGWENPLRLAEDLATVDILSGGPPQPGGQRRPADALRPGQGGALPGHRRRRGLQLRAGATAAATSSAASRPPTSAASRASRCSPTGSSRTPRAWPPDVVRRRQPAVGPVGRRARDEPADQQRREGGGVRGLRRDPALAHPDLPRPPPRRRPGPRLPGARRHPHRHRLAGAARQVRGSTREARRRAPPRRRARRA